MKIKQKILAKIIKESLLSEIPEIGYADPEIASRISKDQGAQRKFNKKYIKDFASAADQIGYDMQKNIASLGKIAKDKEQVPLAVRGFAKWFADDKSVFTENDLTRSEKEILTVLVLLKLQQLNEYEKKGSHWSADPGHNIRSPKYKRKLPSISDILAGKKAKGSEYIIFDYPDYQLFPPLKRKPSSKIDPIWDSKTRKKDIYFKQTGESLAVNISKFLGKFPIKYWLEKNPEYDKSKGNKKYLLHASIEENYDFNVPNPNKPATKKSLNLQQPDTTQDYPKSLAPGYMILSTAYRALWDGNSWYKAMRLSAADVQKFGITKYKIKILLNDLTSDKNMSMISSKLSHDFKRSK
jgi:hypothetical protein